MIFTAVLYSEQFDIINEVQDADLSKRLLSSLAVLKRNGRVDIWDIGEAIKPGEDRDKLIKENLEKADVVLLLFSPNFLHHVWPTIETQIGEIAEHKKAHIIPILLRPTDLKSTRFRSTQNLPRGDYNSITSAPRSKWDTLFFEISRGIDSVIAKLEEEKRKMPANQPAQHNNTRVTQEPQNPNLPPSSQVSPASPPANATRSNPPSLAIITAIREEFAAVEKMLDQHSDVITENDNTIYTIGNISSHRVVVILLPKTGNNLATAFASQLLRSFSVSDILMVGIAGGVPNPKDAINHVRLGDIVVSTKGVVQFDMGRREQIKGNERFTLTADNPLPSARLLQVVELLKARSIGGERPWEQYIARAAQLTNSARPPDAEDQLYDSLNPKEKVPHPNDATRVAGQPKVHYGVIGSSNMFLKDPQFRDRLRDEHKFRAIEMEGAGIAAAAWASGKAGYLIIRGISDYCDSHRNQRWVQYAAIVAAAYARALIESIPGDTTMSDTSQSSDIQPNKLRKILVDYFSIDELQLLCRDIEQDLRNDGIDEKVDLDMIGGNGKEIRCQNLIDYLTRRRILQYLVKAVRRVRPSSI